MSCDIGGAEARATRCDPAGENRSQARSARLAASFLAAPPRGSQRSGFVPRALLCSGEFRVGPDCGGHYSSNPTPRSILPPPVSLMPSIRTAGSDLAASPACQSNLGPASSQEQEWAAPRAGVLPSSRGLSPPPLAVARAPGWHFWPPPSTGRTRNSSSASETSLEHRLSGKSLC